MAVNSNDNAMSHATVIKVEGVESHRKTFDMLKTMRRDCGQPYWDYLAKHYAELDAINRSFIASCGELSDYEIRVYEGLIKGADVLYEQGNAHYHRMSKPLINIISRVELTFGVRFILQPGNTGYVIDTDQTENGVFYMKPEHPNPQAALKFKHVSEQPATVQPLDAGLDLSGLGGPTHPATQHLMDLLKTVFKPKV